MRKWKSRFFISILAFLCFLSLCPLIVILIYVVHQGFQSLSFSFLVELPKPVGEVGGGLANGILGSLILVSLASIFGVTLGFLVGVYLAEYSQSRLGPVVRMSVDLMASIPSIIVGIFVYTILVVPMRRFSAWAGGLALGLLMVPLIARAIEELLTSVPRHIREAGLALGLPRYQVILRIVLRGIMPGFLTSVLVSMARISGETAPLLFTAFGNPYWPSRLDEPIAALPLQIYNYAISPFVEWHQKAWAGAIILVFFVFSVNFLTRLLTRGQTRFVD